MNLDEILLLHSHPSYRFFLFRSRLKLVLLIFRSVDGNDGGDVEMLISVAGWGVAPRMAPPLSQGGST